jgi:iron only hydrogenase large subunit-like protein
LEIFVEYIANVLTNQAIWMEDLVEVIGIKAENCINCHQCIAVCPVKVCSDGSGDVVKFNTALCIGCGRCIDACIKSHGGQAEKSARVAIDDSFQLVKDINKHEIAALVAPSAQCNYNLPQLISALRLLGFTAVYDVSLGAEIAVACYQQAISTGEAQIPLIGSSCPAVVRYIELHHPALIKHLAPTGTPVYDMAVYVKSLHPAARLAFISPCLAKRREFQDSRLIQYNVTYQSLDQILRDRSIDLNRLEGGRFDNEIGAGRAANFSAPGGLKDCFLYNHPATPSSTISRVEGPLVYEKYLTELENDIRAARPGLPIMVDILSCEKGCNMGAGSINRVKSMTVVENSTALRAEKACRKPDHPDRLQAFINEMLGKYDFSYQAYRDLTSRNKIKIPSAAEFDEIYRRMHKTEERDFRNCAACGYNSCHNMAVAIFNGLNKVENCHLYQEKELRQEQDILNKMVNKLEALNTKLQEEFNERKQQEQLLIQNSKLAAMGK